MTDFGDEVIRDSSNGRKDEAFLFDFGSWLNKAFPEGADSLSNRPAGLDDESPANISPDNSIEDVDKVLADALTGLSIQEREKAYEEIHGCDQVMSETPDLLSTSLAEMESSLNSISKKPAYDQAFAKNRQYVEDPVLRLQFLRAEYFHPRQAAVRLVSFLEHKLSLFGTEALARPVYLSDLSKDDMATLQSGYIQILPSRDRTGRPIFMDAQENHYHACRHGDNIVRSFVYMILTLAEDVESQRRGVVCILHYLKSTGKIDPAVAFRCAHAISWLPIRFTTVHCCTQNAMARAALRLIIKQTSEDRKARFRLHDGTQTEIEYSLMNYGLPVSVLPISSGGEIKKKEHQQWIARRKVKDNLMKEQLSSGMAGVFPGIDLPGVNDVLLGRGKKFQEHTGNVRLRQLIYMHGRAHAMTEPGQKSLLVENVIKIIYQENGRFLQRDDSGWWIPAPYKEAQTKVAHTFRTARSTETLERIALKSENEGKRKKLCVGCFGI